MRDILQKIQVHVPFHLLREKPVLRTAPPSGNHGGLPLRRGRPPCLPEGLGSGIEGLLQRVIRDGLNPEISFNHIDLERYQAADFREVADRLVDSGLSVTLHAPFMDLRPGALDPRIRQVTVDRHDQEQGYQAW